MILPHPCKFLPVVAPDQRKVRLVEVENPHAKFTNRRESPSIILKIYRSRTMETEINTSHVSGMTVTPLLDLLADIHRPIAEQCGVQETFEL